MAKSRMEQVNDVAATPVLDTRPRLARGTASLKPGAGSALSTVHIAGMRYQLKAAANGLTKQERDALGLFAKAIKAIFELPECHPSDSIELVAHAHAIQNAVMARAAVRAHDEFTRTKTFR